MKKKKHDPVNYPEHYNKGDIQCIDAIKACQGYGFRYYLQGSALKYIWRHEWKKQPVEDLDKAIWFLNKLTSFLLTKVSLFLSKKFTNS